MNRRRISVSLLVCFFGVESLAVKPSSTDFFGQYSNQPNHTQNVTLAVPLSIEPSIECIRVTAPNLPNLDTSACLEMIPAACAKLSTRFPFMIKRYQWVWTSSEGCSIAHFIPAHAPRSQIPARTECQQQIYGRIVEKCGVLEQFNGGTINVYTLPTPNGPGEALTHDYPRYLIAPNELDRDPAVEA
ncbi:hypothetical protein N7G274_009552 [Stereocaulon virgatum]|uniref:Uncharacterized protein n=1 Tax=Stereocaulon virgatum TaxID=373712 RepID=A0ABR3ZW35_9LECA